MKMGSCIVVGRDAKQHTLRNTLADFTHTDVKPGNILVNYTRGTEQISKVQLADFGSTLSKDSTYAKQGTQVGTPVYISPEVFLELPWSTSLDIWSFGATVSFDLSNPKKYD